MPDSGLVCRCVTFQHSGGPKIFDGLDVRFPGHSVTLVTGPTGIGKSTLLHLLGGLLMPTGGQILAAGQAVSRWRTDHKDRWRRQVGHLFQHLHLINELTVLENIVLPLVPLQTTWAQCQARAAPVLERFDLFGFAHTPVHKLSGGQRQRTALARAMVHQPRYLLLDEPSGFQDERHTLRLLEMLADTAAAGACIVVCSHDPRLVSAHSFFHEIRRLDCSGLNPNVCNVGVKADMETRVP